MSARPEVPGEPTTTGTALPETATAAIQGFGPVKKIHKHLCAFHFHAQDMTRQVERIISAATRTRKCLVYNSPEPDARLIGLDCGGHHLREAVLDTVQTWRNRTGTPVNRR